MHNSSSCIWKKWHKYCITTSHSFNMSRSTLLPIRYCTCSEDQVVWGRCHLTRCLNRIRLGVVALFGFAPELSTKLCSYAPQNTSQKHLSSSPMVPAPRTSPSTNQANAPAQAATSARKPWRKAACASGRCKRSSYCLRENPIWTLLEMESDRIWLQEEIEPWDPNNALWMSMNPRSEKKWVEMPCYTIQHASVKCRCIFFWIYHVPQGACLFWDSPPQRKKTQHKRCRVAQNWWRPQNGSKQN